MALSKIYFRLLNPTTGFCKQGMELNEMEAISTRSLKSQKLL